MAGPGQRAAAGGPLASCRGGDEPAETGEAEHAGDQHHGGMAADGRFGQRHLQPVRADGVDLCGAVTTGTPSTVLRRYLMSVTRPNPFQTHPVRGTRRVCAGRREAGTSPELRTGWFDNRDSRLLLARTAV